MSAPYRFETDQQRSLPSGWWIVPGAILGIAFWVAIAWLAVPALLNAAKVRPAGCEGYRAAEVAACVAEVRP
nr:hypothetical protein [Paracoccus saliphilus]